LGRAFIGKEGKKEGRKGLEGREGLVGRRGLGKSEFPPDAFNFFHPV